MCKFWHDLAFSKPTAIYREHNTTLCFWRWSLNVLVIALFFAVVALLSVNTTYSTMGTVIGVIVSIYVPGWQVSSLLDVQSFLLKYVLVISTS